MVQLTRNEALILLWVCEDMFHYSEGTYLPSSIAERCGFGKKLLRERMQKEDVMSDKADCELGRLVRRMPKDSSLTHCSAGGWAYESSRWTSRAADPEEALHRLRETFAERWLRHYDEIGWSGRGLGKLRRYAMMECGRESELGPPQ